jgi:hypothetical protein
VSFLTNAACTGSRRDRQAACRQQNLAGRVMWHAKSTSPACSCEAGAVHRLRQLGAALSVRAQAQAQGLLGSWQGRRTMRRPARRINHITHIRDWVVWGKGVAASRHSRLVGDPSHQRAAAAAHLDALGTGVDPRTILTSILASKGRRHHSPLLSGRRVRFLNHAYSASLPPLRQARPSH